MTENKPIMIDDIDVTHCLYSTINGGCTMLKTCKGNNCLFKQLALKTQECEIWKNQVLILDGEDVTVQLTQEQFEEYNNFKAENETYKQKLYKIKKVCNKFIPEHYKILLIINGGIVED